MAHRLNTFLELKMEHERLQQRIVQLRAQSQALEGSTDGFFSTSDNFGATEAARTGYDAGAVPDGEDDGPRKKVCSENLWA